MGRIAEALKKAEQDRISNPGAVGRAAGEGIRGYVAEPDTTVPKGARRGARSGVAVATPVAGAPTSPPSDQVFRTPIVETSHAGLLSSTHIRPPRGVDATSRGPLAWDVHPTVVAADDLSSAITEQYRAARTWLLRRNTTGKHDCIAITSSVPREGKSVTTANLSIVMAEVRHLNVLAVDGDLRQGSLARLYRMPNSPGLVDVLAGRSTLEEAILPTPLGNLSFLPAGDCRGLNPAEMLNSRAAVRCFDEIRERFHFSLVDTPPVRRLSDVGVIGALCTGIVMIVRMNKTASHLVRQSLHWLQANNLDVIGCIAADCCVRGARYEYENSDDD